MDQRKNKIIKKLEGKVKYYQDRIKEMSSNKVEVTPIEDITDRLRREEALVKQLERRLRNNGTPAGSSVAGAQSSMNSRFSQDPKVIELKR